MDECGAWLNWKLIDLATLHLVHGGVYFRSPHTFKKGTDAFFSKRRRGGTTSPVCAESGMDQVMFPSHIQATTSKRVCACVCAGG